jgi:hypothetical protein
MQFKNDCADVMRGISDVEKNLRHIEKVPHEDNEASPDVEKILTHVDSASRELRKNPFDLLFSCADMHEEQKDVLFSPGDMHEEKHDVFFSLPEVHPSAMLHTFSAFVLKQRAFVLKLRTTEHNPASAVDNDDAVQHTALAGREVMARIVQQFSIRPCYGAVVSQDATRRKIILTSRPWSGPGCSIDQFHAICFEPHIVVRYTVPNGVVVDRQFLIGADIANRDEPENADRGVAFASQAGRIAMVVDAAIAEHDGRPGALQSKELAPSKHDPLDIRRQLSARQWVKEHDWAGFHDFTLLERTARKNTPAPRRGGFLDVHSGRQDQCGELGIHFSPSAEMVLRWMVMCRAWHVKRSHRQLFVRQLGRDRQDKTDKTSVA